jgi:hypothetical protein
MERFVRAVTVNTIMSFFTQAIKLIQIPLLSYKNIYCKANVLFNCNQIEKKYFSKNAQISEMENVAGSV